MYELCISYTIMYILLNADKKTIDSCICYVVHELTVVYCLCSIIYREMLYMFDLSLNPSGIEWNCNTLLISYFSEYMAPLVLISGPELKVPQNINTSIYFNVVSIKVTNINQ